MEYFFKIFLHLQTLSLLCFLIILHFAFAQCCYHHKFVSHLGWAPSFSFSFFSFSAVCASIDCVFILLSYRAQTGFNQGLLLLCDTLVFSLSLSFLSVCLVCSAIPFQASLVHFHFLCARYCFFSPCPLCYLSGNLVWNSPLLTCWLFVILMKSDVLVLSNGLLKASTLFLNCWTCCCC